MASELMRMKRELAKTSQHTSLDDFAKAGRKRSILLVDVSGSMNEPARSGRRRIVELRTVVAELRETHPVPVAAFGLSGDVTVKLVDSIPDPDGFTPLHDAIDFAKASGATHIVVVSDGRPDSMSLAKEAGRKFGGPIDTFYVGGDDEGAAFMKGLAELTGGSSNVTDLGETRFLVSKIRGLLGPGTPQLRAAIEL